MRKRILLFFSLACLCFFTAAGAAAQRRQPAKPKPQIPRICGDPTVRCRTDYTFEPHQLPFVVKDSGGPIQETEAFYAVVLKTLVTKEAECERFFIESERKELQVKFPHNKVFSDRCPEPDEIYYTGFQYKTRIIAIYGGSTAAAANKILTQVKEQYPKAVVRRMRAGFNGT